MASHGTYLLSLHRGRRGERSSEPTSSYRLHEPTACDSEHCRAATLLQPSTAEAAGVRRRRKRSTKTYAQKRQSGWPAELDSRLIFGGIILTIVVAMPTFAYMSAHVPVGTQTAWEFSRPNCSWHTELWIRGNIFGCFGPRFSSSREPVVNPSTGQHTDATVCGGPLIEHIFENHAGYDDLLDLQEARAYATDVMTRVAKACSPSSVTATPPHVCFAHATKLNRIDRATVPKYSACLVAHITDSCRQSVCALA